MPTDHAGGPLDSYLSLALALSRDGIVGPWDGSADAATSPLVIRGTPLGYLTPALRGDLLDQELISALKVTPGGQKASVGLSSGTALVDMTLPAQKDFAAQMPVLRVLADLREDRFPEILEQVDDLLSFYGAILQLDDSQRKWTIELLEAVVRLAILVEMPLKHGFRAPRPNLFSTRLQPPIQTPTHGSYPSGHATEAYAIATVLQALSGGAPAAKAVADRALLFQLAYRIAENRMVVGVHFPFDSVAGAVLGVTLGEWVVAAATGGKVPPPRHYTPGAERDPFQPDTVAALLQGTPGAALTALPILAEVWANADKEWR